MTAYWDAGHLLLDDRLNADIWAESPGLQRQIQTPEKLTSVGLIGPQQAMLEEHPKLGITPADVLPWVRCTDTATTAAKTCFGAVRSPAWVKRALLFGCRLRGRAWEIRV